MISTGNHTAVAIGQFATGAKIQGNFIGTDVTGTAGLGNHYGISVQGTGATIGGASPAQRNVIADAPVAEILMLATGTVTGNFIGTNSSGTAAFPGNGIGLLAGVDAFGSVIGGTSPGAGNLISGASQNAGNGLDVFADHVEILGNLIGTKVDGASPLPNSGDGIFFEGGRYATVGGTSAGAANTIAFNGGSGSEQSFQPNNASFGDAIRGNSIYSNGARGIKNTNGGNIQLPPPAISQASHSGAGGTACSNCVIDVYSDDASQGRVYEGSTTASGTSWTFSGSIVGPNVTATATDSAGNTSEFSLPSTVGLAPTPSPTATNVSTETPNPTLSPRSTTTPSPSSSLTPTPSPTPTLTPTPSPTVRPSGSAQLRGDADCNGHVDAHDVLAALSTLAHVAPGAACAALAEVDCDSELAADDALRILDFVAGAPLAQPTGCPGVGTLT